MTTTAAPQTAWKSAQVYHDRESANAQATSGYAYSWRYEIALPDGSNLLGGYFTTREEAMEAMDLMLCRLNAQVPA